MNNGSLHNGGDTGLSIRYSSLPESYGINQYPRLYGFADLASSVGAQGNTL
jgi:hypothetical protein